MILSDHGPDPLGGPNCRKCGAVFPCQPYQAEARDFAEAEEARVAAQWGPKTATRATGSERRQ